MAIRHTGLEGPAQPISHTPLWSFRLGISSRISRLAPACRTCRVLLPVAGGLEATVHCLHERPRANPPLSAKRVSRTVRGGHVNLLAKVFEPDRRPNEKFGPKRNVRHRWRPVRELSTSHAAIHTTLERVVPFVC